MAEVFVEQGTTSCGRIIRPLTAGRAGTTPWMQEMAWLVTGREIQVRSPARCRFLGGHA